MNDLPRHSESFTVFGEPEQTTHAEELQCFEDGEKVSEIVGLYEEYDEVRYDGHDINHVHETLQEPLHVATEQ